VVGLRTREGQVFTYALRTLHWVAREGSIVQRAGAQAGLGQTLRTEGSHACPEDAHARARVPCGAAWVWGTGRALGSDAGVPIGAGGRATEAATFQTDLLLLWRLSVGGNVAIQYAAAVKQPWFEISSGRISNSSPRVSFWRPPKC
jgi:hypothetical protein